MWIQVLPDTSQFVTQATASTFGEDILCEGAVANFFLQGESFRGLFRAYDGVRSSSDRPPG